jgi:hypothetical protein
MKIAAFGFAWFVSALLLALPFGYAMRSTPKPDRVRSERQEESEVESVECAEELAAR